MSVGTVVSFLENGRFRSLLEQMKCTVLMKFYRLTPESDEI